MTSFPSAAVSKKCASWYHSNHMIKYKIFDVKNTDGFPDMIVLIQNGELFQKAKIKDNYANTPEEIHGK